MPLLDVTKVTFSFRLNSYGWTENYFRDGVSESFEEVFSKAEALAAKRIKVSGVDTTLPYIKISRENAKRDVKAAGYNYFGSTGKGSEPPQVAILMRRFALLGGLNASVYLRGIWDAVISDGGEIDRGNAAWLGAYSTFTAELVAGNWGFIARNLTSSFTGAVDGVTQNANGTVNIEAKTPIFVGIAAGTLIKIFLSGIQGAVSVNGQQVVEVIDGSNVKTKNRIPMFPYTTGGKISHTEPKWYKDDTFSAVRVVERKPGRPLYLSVGRRGARKLS